MRGHHHSEETKEKMRASWKRRCELKCAAEITLAAA